MLGQTIPTNFYALDILNRNATIESSRHTDTKLRNNMLAQNWHAAERRLPIELRIIEKLRKKYGIAIDSPLPPFETRTEMPIWAHFASISDINRKSSTTREVESCLKQTHEIETVDDPGVENT